MTQVSNYCWATLDAFRFLSIEQCGQRVIGLRHTTKPEVQIEGHSVPNKACGSLYLCLLTLFDPRQLRNQFCRLTRLPHRISPVSKKDDVYSTRPGRLLSSSCFPDWMRLCGGSRTSLCPPPQVNQKSNPVTLTLANLVPHLAGRLLHAR